MTKNKKLIFAFTLILIILVSTTLSFGNFFFTTQYYDAPLNAYNDNCTSDIVYGETKATKQIIFLLMIIFYIFQL